MAHSKEMFVSKIAAYNHFKQRHREGVCESEDIEDIEECECCGEWSVSEAIDYYGGAIVGPWCIFDDRGIETEVLFSRVCVECCNLEEIDARNMAGI